MGKNKLKDITVNFLNAVLVMTDNVLRVAVDRKEVYRILNNQFDEELPLAKLSLFLQNLKSRGYVEIKKGINGDSIQFTDKAQIRVIDKIANQLDWDGKYRFVSFDVPELMRLNRDGFRRSIKKVGFKQIQKSLWVCKKNVGNLVEMASYFHKVEKYVIYIVSEESDIDGIIEKMFRSG